MQPQAANGEIMLGGDDNGRFGCGLGTGGVS